MRKNTVPCDLNQKLTGLADNHHRSSRICHSVEGVGGDKGDADGECLLAAMVVDTTSPGIRGTAFGVFILVTGVASLGGNVVAGLLWDHLGPSSTFFAGAGITAVALVGLLTLQGSGQSFRTRDEG